MHQLLQRPHFKMVSFANIVPLWYLVFNFTWSGSYGTGAAPVFPRTFYQWATDLVLWPKWKQIRGYHLREELMFEGIWCGEVWRRMELQRRWERQNYFSFVGKNAPLLPVMVVRSSNIALSHQDLWNGSTVCSVTAYSWFPNFFFPSFALLVSLQSVAQKTNSCRTWECECLLTVSNLEFSLWLLMYIYASYVFELLLF